MKQPIRINSEFNDKVTITSVENSINDSNSPKTYRCKFIEPGVVAYKEHGTVLVQKPILDLFLNTFIDKPVINEEHKSIDITKPFLEQANGIVKSVWRDEIDGWYCCEFVVWDEATKENIEKNGYSVSCAYDIIDYQNGGTYHNIDYTLEVLNGNYTHLAVVKNPRYEDAKILLNSKGEEEMSKMEEVLNKISDLVNSMAPRKAKNEETKDEGKEEKKEEVKNESVTLEDIYQMLKKHIEEESKKEAENMCKAEKAEAKNEDEKESKEEKVEEEKKEEMKNEETKEEEKKDEKKEAENSKEVNHFEALNNAIAKGKPEILNSIKFDVLNTRENRLKLGQEAYGSRKGE